MRHSCIKQFPCETLLNMRKKTVRETIQSAKVTKTSVHKVSKHCTFNEPCSSELSKQFETRSSVQEHLLKLHSKKQTPCSYCTCKSRRVSVTINGKDVTAIHRGLEVVGVKTIQQFQMRTGKLVPQFSHHSKAVCKTRQQDHNAA